MKKLFNFLVVAIALGAVAATSCTPSQDGSQSGTSDSTAVDSVDTRLAAIESYLINTIGAQYAGADVCIPCPIVTATDDSDTTDIRVWGDFWVLNYEIAGDTLKNTSGGSHPGMMHLRQGADGRCQVTAFDQVSDGSGFESTAKEIFGDKYDAFMKSHSDDKAREQALVACLAGYVKANGLNVKFYQDYGWPAKPLPQQ